MVESVLNERWLFRMNKLLITFLVFGFLSACSSRTSKNDHFQITKNPAYYIFEGDSVIIPDFRVEIDLSPKASEKIKNDKETIIVSAYFFGQGATCI
jgi:hypothetical protein